MPGELSCENLRVLLPPGLDVIVLDEVDSTNDFAMRRAKEKGVHGDAVVAARMQTGGKGTKGRAFYSPKDSGLYLSVLLRTGQTLCEMTAPTPAAAVAVCRAVEAETGLPLQIKWVNDILLFGKKLCGILAESCEDPVTGLVSVIIGVGVNISTGVFPEEFAARAASLADFCGEVDVNRLAARTVRELLRLAKQPDPHIYMDEYRGRSSLLGKMVGYRTGGAEKSGIAFGITEEGHLLVRTETGMDELRSADASVSALE